jgi:hypothetical protein
MAWHGFLGVGGEENLGGGGQRADTNHRKGDNTEEEGEGRARVGGNPSHLAPELKEEDGRLRVTAGYCGLLRATLRAHCGQALLHCLILTFVA